ncbi:MAG: histidine kinase, partial [Flavobacterium sp.]|nr:histidine kinase [Flavobacterium sp.]
MNFYLRHFLRAIGIGTAIIGVLLLLRWMNGNPVPINDAFWLNVEFTMLYTVALYMANMAVFVVLDRMFKKDRFALKRVIIGFLSSFVVSIAVIFLLRAFEEIQFNGLTFR